MIARRDTVAQPTIQTETAGTLWEAANRAAAAGRLAEYQQLMAKAVGLAPQHPAVLYGLARADALTNRPTESLALLDRLASMGFGRFDEADTAFRSLASRPAFVRLVARFAANRQPVIASGGRRATTAVGSDMGSRRR